MMLSPTTGYASQAAPSAPLYLISDHEPTYSTYLSLMNIITCDMHQPRGPDQTQVDLLYCQSLHPSRAFQQSVQLIRRSSPPSPRTGMVRRYTDESTDSFHCPRTLGLIFRGHLLPILHMEGIGYWVRFDILTDEAQLFQSG